MSAAGSTHLSLHTGFSPSQRILRRDNTSDNFRLTPTVRAERRRAVAKNNPRRGHRQRLAYRSNSRIKSIVGSHIFGLLGFPNDCNVARTVPSALCNRMSASAPLSGHRSGFRGRPQRVVKTHSTAVRAAIRRCRFANISKGTCSCLTAPDHQPSASAELNKP